MFPNLTDSHRVSNCTDRVNNCTDHTVFLYISIVVFLYNSGNYTGRRMKFSFSHLYLDNFAYLIMGGTDTGKKQVCM